MGSQSQSRALANYRKRLSQRGMARFEVLGLETDRDLIRAVARRLADRSPEAAQIRSEIRIKVAEKPGEKGGILAALRRSPLVGAELELTRAVIDGRPVEL